eukprot:SAG31_NODE_2459_length_5660_cov_13.094947_4_plen_529_part_00
MNSCYHDVIFPFCRCGGDNSTCADCRGQAYGKAAIDPNCGRDSCPGNRHPTEDRCYSMTGVDGSQYNSDPNCKLPADFCKPDCAGEWGGTKTIDNCSVCGGDNSSCTVSPARIKAECPQTQAELDEMRLQFARQYFGASVTMNSPEMDRIRPNGCSYRRRQLQSAASGGGLQLDLDLPLGTEIDASSLPPGASTEPMVTDCNGTAVPANSDYLRNDACFVCGGDNSTCLDCSGIPNGNATTDSCGTCDSNATNDCVLDCFGAWGGSAVLDACDVCNGNNGCKLCPEGQEKCDAALQCLGGCRNCARGSYSLPGEQCQPCSDGFSPTEVSLRNFELCDLLHIIGGIDARRIKPHAYRAHPDAMAGVVCALHVRLLKSQLKTGLPVVHVALASRSHQAQQRANCVGPVWSRHQIRLTAPFVRLGTARAQMKHTESASPAVQALSRRTIDPVTCFRGQAAAQSVLQDNTVTTTLHPVSRSAASSVKTARQLRTLPVSTLQPASVCHTALTRIRWVSFLAIRSILTTLSHEN